MLPDLNYAGDLPPGLHDADWEEIKRLFGVGSPARERAYAKLRHLHTVAERTGKLSALFVFGSFVSSKADPRDIDVILLMNSDFRAEEAPPECRALFSHADAEARYGASVFWLRQGMLTERTISDFFDVWATKRDGTKRGILRIRPS